MTVTAEKDNNSLKLIVEGDLNTLSSTDLEKAYVANKDGVNDVVIDMAGVTYISSAGLRVMLYIDQEMLDIGGSFTVCNVNSDVMEVFRLSGFVQFLKIK